MTAANSLVFKNFDPVTGQPTVDGFTTTDLGVITREAEPGYVNGSRVTLGFPPPPGGAGMPPTVNLGLPPVIIQTIKDGNTLVIGITCRGDTSFDPTDAVVIALRPNGGSAAGAQRRIDIFPCWSGITPDPVTGVIALTLPNPPAAAPNLGVGYGAAVANPGNAGLHLDEPPVNTLAPTGDNSLNQIHTNKPPYKGPVFYQRSGSTGAWSVMASPPNNTETKVRSWRPTLISTTTIEAAWSVEVRIPINIATGGAGWIDLADDFGIFIDVIRSFRMAEEIDGDGLFGPNDDAYFASAQSLFPIGAPTITGVIGTSTDIPSSSFGHGLMNAATVLGEGVSIRNNGGAIGRRPANDTSAPLTNAISWTTDNHIVAQIQNTGPAANGIKATVRMANWGLSSPNFAAWNEPPGCENPSFPAVDLPPGTMAIPSLGETTNEWPAATIVSIPGANNDYRDRPHQCMWVQLDSTVSGVNFVQSSARSNMDFTNLSTVEREAEVSGIGYPDPVDGTDKHDFVLFTRCRKIVVQELVDNRKEIDIDTLQIVSGALRFTPEVPNPDDGVDIVRDTDGRMTRMSHAMVATRRTEQQWRDSVVYMWITEGFRRTGKFLEINGIVTEVLDNSPGDFGLIAHHKGVNDSLSWSFAGPDMVQYSPGVYGLKVPHKGTTSIQIRLAADKDGPVGDNSNDLPRGSGPRPERPKPQGDRPNDPNPDGPKPGDDNGGTTTSGKTGCPAVILALAAIPAIWAVAQAVI